MLIVYKTIYGMYIAFVAPFNKTWTINKLNVCSVYLSCIHMKVLYNPIQNINITWISDIHTHQTLHKLYIPYVNMHILETFQPADSSV